MNELEFTAVSFVSGILLYEVPVIFYFCIDANSNPSGGFSVGNLSPFLLILGYANGIHIWMIPVTPLHVIPLL